MGNGKYVAIIAASKTKVVRIGEDLEILDAKPGSMTWNPIRYLPWCEGK